MWVAECEREFSKFILLGHLVRFAGASASAILFEKRPTAASLAAVDPALHSVQRGVQLIHSSVLARLSHLEGCSASCYIKFPPATPQIFSGRLFAAQCEASSILGRLAQVGLDTTQLANFYTQNFHTQSWNRRALCCRPSAMALQLFRDSPQHPPVEERVAAVVREINHARDLAKKQDKQGVSRCPVAR